MLRRRYILLILLVGLMLGVGGPSQARNGAVRQDRCQDGTYTVTIRGYYTGTGTAEVGPTSVRIDAEVRTEGGQVGRLRGTFPATGPYFSGQGTIMRENAVVRGRLDAAKASRLVATFYDSSGHSGRIGGILPTDAGDETWDQIKGN